MTTDNIYSENLADFGSREKHMAIELLNADLPRNFSWLGVKIAMNNNSGYVFLINDDYQVAMMNGDTMEIYYTTPYHGFEGFIDELLNDDPNIMNSEDADYILECAENDNVELPIIWQQYKENQLNFLNENTKEDYDETA
jgi:hypothetical protein